MNFLIEITIIAYYYYFFRVSSNWKKLTNILSGQFCASLNFIDDTNTAVPKFSFRPEGSMPSDFQYNSSFVRYSSMPPEIVCTENLTPFRKLLPCSSMVSFSHYIFKHLLLL